MKFEEFPNTRKAEIYKKHYNEWKIKSLEFVGFFPIFQSFKEEFLLRELSGNALKLYIYLGLKSGNTTGETWVSIDTVSAYFKKSPRTISYWIDELIKFNLIKRVQFNYNEVAHTFLVPYGREFLLSKIFNNEIKEREGRNE